MPELGKDAYEYDDNSTDHLIGRGAFSLVYKATRKLDNHIVAIKVS